VIFNKNVNALSMSGVEESDVYENLEKEVISKFLDNKCGKESPFSIKEITDQGLECFK